MYLSEIRIENFRIFGEGEQGFILPLRPGLTALVGENDTGKTAVIDALRLALGTRDQEFFRLEDDDFHQPPGASDRRKEIRIRCKFEGLTPSDRGAFAEYLTYEEGANGKTPVLYVNWTAVAAPKSPQQRRFTSIETHSGKLSDGPQFDQAAKTLLWTTYLRPLRDAERAMSAGRGSRLSQILQHTKEIKEQGQNYDPAQGAPSDLSILSVQGIGDLANALLGNHVGVRTARDNLNAKYLEPLSFAGSKIEGSITVSGPKGDADAQLRLLLEKLDLELRDSAAPQAPPNRGLGSNNILFMACELLLLGAEEDGFPLLLIEEPEAHLHPQRQLLLMQFLQQKAREVREDQQRIQVILTTHSPNLASAIELDNLVLLNRCKAFPLARGYTELAEADYGFLTRFLDVTKANLFFARGVLIVEGDAENILIPTLARLLGRDLTTNGVSIVNVGGTGLSRFARIFLRSNPKNGTIDIPVACVTDLDVMPDCAPEIIALVKPGDNWPEKRKRRWRAKQDFPEGKLQAKREEMRARASSQRVQTFVADEWTLEYDLAFAGLAEDVWIAARQAMKDEVIKAGKRSEEAVARAAMKSYAEVIGEELSREEVASNVYALFARGSGVSKAIAAQYLAARLEKRKESGELAAETLRGMLPDYIVNAIEYVTVDAQPASSPATEASDG